MDEMWVIIEGGCELWRRSGDGEDIETLKATTATSIPAEVDFQYRTADRAMKILVATFPRFRMENWSPAAGGPWGAGGEEAGVQGSKRGDWETIQLPAEPTRLAPDGSEMRLLPERDSGRVAHSRLPAGSVALAVRHPRVQELWYVLGGEGEMWRSAGEQAEVRRPCSGDRTHYPAGDELPVPEHGPGTARHRDRHHAEVGWRRQCRPGQWPVGERVREDR
jgi:mannose-6-phosphate isomerase-like protein (cupin superfamily)